MSKERDPTGRFVKTPSDGAQAGSEPEAEPAEPGNLAQLLAAVGDQIRGLERRQTEARETDNAALRADLNRVERLARTQPGAGDGPPRTGSEATGFVTPPADVRAALRPGGEGASAAERVEGEAAAAGVSGGPASTRASVLRVRSIPADPSDAEIEAAYGKLEVLVDRRNAARDLEPQIVLVGTVPDLAEQVEAILRGSAGPPVSIPYADGKYPWPESWLAQQGRGVKPVPFGQLPTERQWSSIVEGYELLSNAAQKTELHYLYVTAARLRDVSTAVRSAQGRDFVARDQVRAAAQEATAKVQGMLEERLDSLIDRCFARAQAREGGEPFETEAEIFAEATFQEQMRRAPTHLDDTRKAEIKERREKIRTLQREAQAKLKAKEQAARVVAAGKNKNKPPGQSRG